MNSGLGQAISPGIFAARHEHHRHPRKCETGLIYLIYHRKLLTACGDNAHLLPGQGKDEGPDMPRLPANIAPKRRCRPGFG
ncbi:hypothetical protein GCM10011273_18220 [Asticcacaulis endophyticus]|uniref:Uncharacterized protein n=1 Tax=Asticcacaulis endophyticus TaxID=1395890 RepID=A0A918UTQ0_9CAUL|nr:hypothetical protein GCM10011273_18220 [Asticcacaulis endophyticus]